MCWRKFESYNWNTEVQSGVWEEIWILLESPVNIINKSNNKSLLREEDKRRIFKAISKCYLQSKKWNEEIKIENMKF